MANCYRPMLGLAISCRDLIHDVVVYPVEVRKTRLIIAIVFAQYSVKPFLGQITPI